MSTIASSFTEMIKKLANTGSKLSNTVSDVAEVVVGYSEGSQEAKYNGKPAVSFQIEKTVDQDIKKITDALYEYKKTFDQKNPDFEYIFWNEQEFINRKMKFKILDSNVSLTMNIFIVIANIINIIYNLPQVIKTYKTKSSTSFFL